MSPNQQYAENTPYVFAHSLGQQLDLSAQEFPSTNSDGLPVVDLTPEQKYSLSTSTAGFSFPGVLSQEEAEEMRDFGLRLQHNPESISSHERSPLGRAAAETYRPPRCSWFHERICRLSASLSPRLLRIPHGVLQPVLSRGWRR